MYEKSKLISSSSMSRNNINEESTVFGTDFGTIFMVMESLHRNNSENEGIYVHKPFCTWRG